MKEDKSEKYLGEKAVNVISFSMTLLSEIVIKIDIVVSFCAPLLKRQSHKMFLFGKLFFSSCCKILL
jgi:hypothetical protein